MITVTAEDADRPDHYGYSEVRYAMDDDRFDIDPISVSVNHQLFYYQKADNKIYAFKFSEKFQTKL